MAMTDIGGVTTVSEGSYTVASNTETAEQIREGLGTTPDPEETISKAASELGKKGGEASAAKRAEAAESATKAKEATPEPASGAETPEQAAEAKKTDDPRHDPQARVAQATRQAKEAREALAAERVERERLATELARERAARERPAAPAKPPPSNGKPDPKDFESYEAYLDARDDHNQRQWTAEAARQRQAHEYQARIGGHVSEFSKHLNEAAKADPEFNDKVSPEILGLRPSFTLPGDKAPNGETWIADELIFSPENAPPLMLHLTEHPDEFQRIASLSSPRAVTREMAKITAKLASAKEAATAGASAKVEVSKAKPPIQPVVGTPYTAESNELNDSASLSAFVQRFGERELRSRR